MYMVVQITKNSCLKLIEGEIEIKLFMIQLNLGISVRLCIVAIIHK